MATFASLSGKNSGLIRKALDGSLFVAAADADAIADLTTGASSALSALPTGYEDGGLMTDEGIRFSREIETSDITSWGRTEPTRSDVTRDVTGIQVDFQETKALTISMYTGIDVSAMTPDATTGEIQIAKPAQPSAKYFRLLALAVDQSETGDEIYIARFFPRAKVTDFSEQAWSKGDDALIWGMTFSATFDEELGYSQIDYLAGPGALALAADMGFA